MMTTRRFVLASGSLLALVAAGFSFPAIAQTSAPAVAAQTAISEQEAHAIAVDAYLYFYPLLGMDLTRRQSTNIEAGKVPGFGPANMFHSFAAFPAADNKLVVRVNFDTLYSWAFIDLTKEPVVLSAPETNGRYYLLPMLDMWSDIFASPGWRTTGTHAGNFLVTAPDWSGDVPSGMTRISAPTPYVWIFGRTQTNGPSDYDAVHKVQDGYKVALQSQWGTNVTPPRVTTDPSLDMKTAPTVQVDKMKAQEFFGRAAELLKVIPPHITDQPMIARLKRVGIEPGKSFDLNKADPDIQRAFANAPEEAQKLMAWSLPTIARKANGWLMNTNNMGVYGNWYLKRAMTAHLALGANLPEDATYPLNLGDSEGRPLDGTYKYTLHFDKGETPPASAFWSVTLYDAEGFQVANPLNRFTLSSWMPLKYNADGSLDLHFQNESPDTDEQTNWLPAPKGPFNLILRLYAPKSEVLSGKWNPPPVVRVALPGLGAQ
ncbi:MAG TPA: DUF1254 domain-containing protein [Candidatus Sulfotelmatobacter sp.]